MTSEDKSSTLSPSEENKPQAEIKPIDTQSVFNGLMMFGAMLLIVLASCVSFQDGKFNFSFDVLAEPMFWVMYVVKILAGVMFSKGIGGLGEIKGQQHPDYIKAKTLFNSLRYEVHEDIKYEDIEVYKRKKFKKKLPTKMLIGIGTAVFVAPQFLVGFSWQSLIGTAVTFITWCIFGILDAMDMYKYTITQQVGFFSQQYKELKEKQENGRNI